MRVTPTATILLATSLLLTACNKAEAPAEATDNGAMAATGAAMDAATPADVNNSGVPEMSSSGPGIIPGQSTSDGADADAPQTTNTTTPN